MGSSFEETPDLEGDLLFFALLAAFIVWVLILGFTAAAIILFLIMFVNYLIFKGKINSAFILAILVTTIGVVFSIVT